MSKTTIYLASKKEWNEQFEKTKSIIDQFVPTVFTRTAYFKFLEFLSKWNHYSVYNIILIYNQFPNATYLASFNRWEELSLKQYDGKKRTVIQPKYHKKGIALLIPLSLYQVEKGPNERFISYKRITVFDVSQTNNITAPEPFSPYVAIKDMDFDLFLSLLRGNVKEVLYFVPYKTKENLHLFRSAQLIDNTIFYHETDADKNETVFSAFIRYVTQKVCLEQNVEGLFRTVIFLSAKRSLFSFYGFHAAQPYDEARILSDIEKIRTLTPDKQIAILHAIQLVIKKCIYRIHSGFKVYLATISDNSNEDFLASIEREVLRDLLP